jgi:hypothetical protein
MRWKCSVSGVRIISWDKTRRFTLTVCIPVRGGMWRLLPIVTCLILFSIALASIFVFAQHSHQVTSNDPIGGVSTQPRLPFLEDSVLSPTGHWTWGQCQAVVTLGSFALIGNGSLLQTITVSRNHPPQLVREYATHGPITDIARNDTLVFVCSGNLLMVFSMANPLSPELLSETIAPGGAMEVTIDFPRAYAVGTAGTITIIDVSDPHLPALLTSFETAGISHIIGVKSGYVYVGSYSGFRDLTLVCDTRNLDSISTRIASYLVAAGTCGIIRDSILYVGTSKAVTLWNIAVPDSPKFLDGTGTSEAVGGIVLKGDTLLAAAGNRMFSINISNPANVSLTSYIEGRPGISYALTASGGLLLSAVRSGLWVVPYDSMFVADSSSFYPTNDGAYKIAAGNGYVAAACGRSGVWILKSTENGDIERISNISLQGLTTDLSMHGTMIFARNYDLTNKSPERGLWIVDIANADSPKVLGHYQGQSEITPGGAGGDPNMVVNGNYVFLTYDHLANQIDTSLDIVDASDPMHPMLLKSYLSEESHLNIATNPQYAYVARGGVTRILDWASSDSIVTVGSFADGGNVLSLDDTLLVVGSSNLHIYSIADPIHPRLLASVESCTGYGAFGLEMSNGYLYQLERYLSNALAVTDIRDPRSPANIGCYIEYWGASDVEAVGERVYIAAGTNGIWTMKNRLVTNVEQENEVDPLGFNMQQNYPNPFNSQTHIRFTLAQRDRVSIQVFNILGQSVGTAYVGELDAGIHQLPFAYDGPSGVLMCRISSTHHVAWMKMLVMR